MSRSKRKKFAENEKRMNILEPGKPLFEKIKGQWAPLFFKNEQPLTVELACGRGEYTVGLARHFPVRNFVGVDLKGDRIWKGSGMAIEEGLKNVGFLRTNIYFLPDFFEPGEISEFWITFPDPRPKLKDAKRRITHPEFLELYKRLIDRDGFIRFKTDNTDLFNYTLEMIGSRTDIRDLEYTHDLYHSGLRPECFDIRTRYEEKFSAEGHDIKYLRYRYI